MTAVRVAVQVGGATVRVAVADGPPRLLAELPAEVLSGPADLPFLLASLLGPTPVHPVIVHPGWWPASEVARWPGRPVAAPVAVAGGARRVVLDVGGAGAEATSVDHGMVLDQRRCGTGGARLDTAVGRLVGTGPGSARRVREALSLLPAAGGIDAEQLRVALMPLLAEVVELVRAVAANGAAPVLLVGGVARSPLLAELLDEAGIPDVVVVPRPDAAAVLGALVLPTAELDEDSACGDPAGAATSPTWLPLPPRGRRPARVLAALVAATVAVVVLLAAGTLLPPSPDAGERPVPSGVLVQYGYRIDVPAGWEHTGGMPERRRSLLTPAATPEGSDLIAVERSPLGYDSGAEPERARAELRAVYDAAVAGGSALSGYGTARVAGREVTTYRQRDGARLVDWYVLLDGDTQLSVGCRHTPAGEPAVRAACAVVVGSLRPA